MGRLYDRNQNFVKMFVIQSGNICISYSLSKYKKYENLKNRKEETEYVKVFFMEY